MPIEKYDNTSKVSATSNTAAPAKDRGCVATEGNGGEENALQFAVLIGSDAVHV